MINKFLKKFGIQLHKEYWVNRIGWCNAWTINEYKYRYTKIAYMIVVDRKDV